MKLTFKYRSWVWLLALVMCGPVTVGGLVGCGGSGEGSGENTYDVSEEEEDLGEEEEIEEE